MRLHYFALSPTKKDPISLVFQVVDKVDFMPQKGSGNKGFPEWNPQSELISDEENSEFQGFSADGTRLFVLLSKQVEILIST